MLSTTMYSERLRLEEACPDFLYYLANNIKTKNAERGIPS